MRIFVALAMISILPALGCTQGLDDSVSDDSELVVGQVFPDSVFENLDYGLYWFGYENSYQKAENDKENLYFDPTRPTIIHIHGWQRNSVIDRKRTLLDLRDDTFITNVDVDLAAPWLDRGYNIGILYWTQFADEGNVNDAEAKIWTADGPRDMRWRALDGGYRDGPAVSAATLLFESYRDAMVGFAGSEIRLTGHSLGNQMAIAVAKEIHDAVVAGEIAANLRPDRIALLDPYYSTGRKSWLGNRWTGEVARDYQAELIEAGVAFEAYRSSIVSGGPFGDSNDELMSRSAFVSLRPWYYNAFDLARKHLVAYWHYYWSMGFAAPDAAGESRAGLSASTSRERVLELMSSDQRLVYDDGVFTTTPEDDTYRLTRK